jgi:hypothetical protein
VEVFLVVVGVVIVAVVAALAVSRMRARTALGSPAAPTAASADAPRLRAPVREFHVRGGEALVSFDVPLPPGPVDDVLHSLLVREAVEVVREKRSRHLPLDDVTTVRAFARRDGADAEVGSIVLEVVGVLPPADHPTLGLHFTHMPFDPLAYLGEQEFTVSPEVAARTADESLRPLGRDLELTSVTASALRAQGTDPATMGTADLALGLLRFGGYQITDAARPGAYYAARHGTTTYVEVVEHRPGEYPELEERAVDAFMSAFAGSGAERGLLFSAKYGPYLVYDKERREPRARFITRERLQSFVDGFSLG